MVKITLFIAAWVGCSLPVWAQERFDPVAVSGGGVWIRQGSDPWCVLDAQPLLSFVGSPRFGVAYSPGVFELGELAASAVTFVFPVPSGGAGVALTRFGFDLYNEYTGAVAWGAGTGPLRYGGSLRYRRIAIRGYGSAGVVTADLGGLLVPASWFRAGVRLTDVTRPSLGGSGERVPAGVNVAVMFILPGLLDCSIQAGQDAVGEISGSAAVSVRCTRWMLLRGGASGDFGRLHGGIILDGGVASVGYAFSLDPLLGLSQMFSLTFILPG